MNLNRWTKIRHSRNTITDSFRYRNNPCLAMHISLLPEIAFLENKNRNKILNCKEVQHYNVLASARENKNSDIRIYQICLTLESKLRQ
jgi:hypothetical protein